MKVVHQNNLCNPTVFENVYQSLSGELCNFLYYTYGDMQAAEDVTQNVFLKLWERCKEFSTTHLKSLLFTMGKNESLNKIKHQKVVLDFATSRRKEDMADTKTPDFYMEREQFEKQVKKAISNLTEKERQVFLMNRIDKKKYKEIAEMLDISVKAVEKRMHNALLKIKKNVLAYENT